MSYSMFLTRALLQHINDDDDNDDDDVDSGNSFTKAPHGQM